MKRSGNQAIRVGAESRGNGKHKQIYSIRISTQNYSKSFQNFKITKTALTLSNFNQPPTIVAAGHLTN